MSDETKDRVQGTVEEAKGRGKEAWGDLTGNEQAQAEGQAEQAKGNLRQGLADAKEKVNETIDKATDRT